MHKEGWLSGSLYLSRPKRVRNNDGDIVFSLHGSNYPKGEKLFNEVVFSIEKGDMVLFPSSLFHATIPFTSDEKRITLAFDIMPK
jgi:ectoine hydroxylase-related dioxygenase (phytanoyl-CoA dioxygenase family)